MDAILNRRSIRKYSDKEIANDILLELCRYAEAAPSARNQRGRAYIIINDKEIISRLSEVSMGSKILKSANKCICVVGKDPASINTPHMQPQDLSAAAENILLRATELNIASCWVGIYPLEDRMTSLREILNIKAPEFPFCLIALGYPEDSNSFYDANKKPDISFNLRG